MLGSVDTANDGVVCATIGVLNSHRASLFAFAVTVTYVMSVAVSKLDFVMTVIVVDTTVESAVLPGTETT